MEHCIKNTNGWNLIHELSEFIENSTTIIDKVTFGSRTLGELLAEEHLHKPISQVELLGVCTDICVISNALLLKAFLPEVRICVNSNCCAGTTPENHELALSAMKLCQIDILNKGM